MKTVRLSYSVLHLHGPGDAPSDVLRFLLLVDIPATMLRPDCNFGGIFVFWDLYGFIGFHGRKGIYSGVFHSVVQADGVAGSNTAFVRPTLRARKCQHITEYAERLTGATQISTTFTRRHWLVWSSAFSLVWGPLGKGFITVSWEAPERCHAGELIRQLLLWPLLGRDRSSMMSRYRSLPSRTSRSSRWAGCGFPSLVVPRASRLRRPVCESQTWTWLRALARTSVPIPVRSPEKESNSSPMGHVSVPFRHASCGAAYSPMGVVARSGRQSASEGGLF